MALEALLLSPIMRREEVEKSLVKLRRGQNFRYINLVWNQAHINICLFSDYFLVDDGYYPGLVNISGTYCFMNSTIQVCKAQYLCGRRRCITLNSILKALSSLSYLQPHLDAIHEKAELLDVPTPVIDTLRDLLHREPRCRFHPCTEKLTLTYLQV
jgi:hypothetical protein